MTHSLTPDLLDHPSSILYICLDLAQTLESLLCPGRDVADHVVCAHISRSGDSSGASDRISGIRAALSARLVRVSSRVDVERESTYK